MRILLNRPYTATEIAEIAGGVALGAHRSGKYLTTDTRELKQGDIFVALRGENFDGNRFLAEAAERGAAFLITEEEPTPLYPSVCVKNSYTALTALAKEARERIAPTVIAITGSVGKTTVKNMISAVLSPRFRVHKTEGNHNNLLGTSLTLLSMPQDTEILVAEAGMNHMGELAELSVLLCPDIAVITNIGRAHIGNLGSRENIARAKLEILLHAVPGAFLLCPENEPLLAGHIGCFRRITVGDGAAADCRYQNYAGEYADFSFRERRYPKLRLSAVGIHTAYCACFAVALGSVFGIGEEEIRRALAAPQTDGMRGECAYVGGICLIKDCYNAAPESVKSALTLLAERNGGRKIALLGDMLELGEYTRALHEEIGEFVAKTGVDLLFTFGAAAQHYASGARRAGMAEECIFENPNPCRPEDSAAALLSVLREGDALLIKASRALRAEQIADMIAQKIGDMKGNGI